MAGETGNKITFPIKVVGNMQKPTNNVSTINTANVVLTGLLSILDFGWLLSCGW